MLIAILIALEAEGKQREISLVKIVLGSQAAVGMGGKDMQTDIEGNQGSDSGTER